MEGTATTGAAPTQAAPSSTGQTGQASQPSQSAPANTQQKRSWGDPAPKADTQPAQNEKPQPKELTEDLFDALVTTKVNGKETKKSVRELLRDAQMAAAAQEKFQRASEMDKRYKQDMGMLGLLESDPEEFANWYSQKTGKQFNLKSFAENLVAKQIEMQSMTPEARELMQIKAQQEREQRTVAQKRNTLIEEIKKIGDVPDQLKNAPLEHVQLYLAQAKSVFKNQQSILDKQMTEAWGEAGLPKHPWFGAMMAHEMLSHRKKTGQSLQPKEAAAKIKSGYQNFVKTTISQMDAKAIQELLGKEVVQKLRDYDIEAATGQKPVASQNLGSTNPASNQPKQMNELQWRQHMGLA